MAKWVIVTESGSDITPRVRDEYGIKITPMYVQMGNESRKDGSFPVDEIFDSFSKTKTLPKTSGATIDDYGDVFREINRENPGCNILHLGYSAVTTVSFNNSIITGEFMDNVVHIDTKQVSAGLGAIVKKTAEFLKANPDADKNQVEEAVNGFINHINFAFFPGDLKYLKAGGRVSNSAYLVASALSLKPLIEMKDGQLTATKKYRGSDKKIYTDFAKDYLSKNHFEKDSLITVYSGATDEKLKKEVERELKKQGYKHTSSVQTGGVISCHCGPGAFGIVGFNRE